MGTLGGKELPRSYQAAARQAPWDARRPADGLSTGHTRIDQTIAPGAPIRAVT